MAKKPRENRIPIMMSDDELNAIDNWRYGNRVATRSDAIRRLCQMALVLDSELTNLHDDMQNSKSTLASLFMTAAKILEDKENADLDEELLFRTVRANFYITKLSTTLRHVTGQAYNFKDESATMDAAMQESSNLKEFFSQLFNKSGMKREILEAMEEMNKKYDSNEE